MEIFQFVCGLAVNVVLLFSVLFIVKCIICRIMEIDLFYLLNLALWLLALTLFVHVNAIA